MRKATHYFFLLSTVPALLLGNGDFDTFFKLSDHKYNIDYRILKKVSIKESGLNPYAIGVYGSPVKIVPLGNALHRHGIYCEGRSKNPSLLSVYPKSKPEALVALKAVRESGLKYDIGLMQISSGNIKRNGWDDVALFDPEENIDKGAGILRWCYDTSKGGGDTLECYNKGKQFHLYDYSYAAGVAALLKEYE